MRKIFLAFLYLIMLVGPAIADDLGSYPQVYSVDDNDDMPLFIAGQLNSNKRIKYRDFKMVLPYGAWTTFGNDSYLVPSGNVGIGTHLPLQKVDVIGNVQTSGSFISNGSSSILFKPNLATITNPTVGYLNFNGGLLPAGNIGIGTVPVEALHVIGKIKTSVGVVYPDGSVQVSAASSGVAAGVGTELQARASSGGFQAVPNSTVDSNGNIGIGTITPIRKLEVGGSDATLGGTATGTAGLGVINYNTTDGNASEVSFSTVDTNGARAAASKIQGIITSHSPSAITGDFVVYNRNAGTMSENLRLTSAGNLGVGTSIPLATVDASKNYTTAVSTKVGFLVNSSPFLTYDGSVNTGQDETIDHAFEAIKFTTTTTTSAQVDTIRMKVSSISTLVNPQDSFTFKIYSDNAGVPGSQLGGTTATTTRYGYLTAGYSSVYANAFVGSLTAGTYWFVISYTKAPTGATISMDTKASGSGTHAYSDNGTAWTTEDNKDGYLTIRRSGNHLFQGTNLGGGTVLFGSALSGQALDITGNGPSGIGGKFTSLDGTGVQGISTNGSGAVGQTSFGIGVFGSGGVNGTGVAATQSGSMTWNGYSPTLSAARSVTIGTWNHYGDVLQVSSSVADTGDLMRVLKQNVPKLKIASTGNMTIGGNVVVADTSTVGAEKCLNTGFTGNATSWTLGAGWAYSSNNVLHTAGNTGTLSQDCGEVAGETYLLSYDIGSWHVGFITASVGSTSAIPNATNATFKKIITAQDTGDVTLTPSSDFDGTIDNVSLKKITGGQLTTIGNVGVGTNAPGKPLDVWGDMRLGNGGKIYIGGNVGISCSGSSVTCTRMEGGACTAGSCVP